MNAALVLGLCVLGLVARQGQSPVPKVSVAVVANAQDGVGRRMVYALREGIRASRGLALQPESKAEIVLRFISVDDSALRSGNAAAYGVVWTASMNCGQVFLHQVAGTCGSDRARKCGDQLVADTDEIVGSFKR